MRKPCITVIIFFLFARSLWGQTCTNTGQTPSSAILLCGSASFSQNSIPLCGQSDIPVPCPATSLYKNTNPVWFRLVCFSSGTLGFIITPTNPDENFDWQLFDISGRNDDDVFTDPSLFLACNWCGDPGETGASVDGNSLTVCTGTSLELFSKMPDIIQGHEYLLMVSHRNSSDQGFQIIITGGNASVTDPAAPALLNARLSCSGNEITVLLNKKMFCSTIAPDGSDFILSTGATINSAIISGCSNVEANLVILLLSNPIPPGNYTLAIQTGSDGNTIEDRCNRYISPGNNVPVIMPSLAPTSMDSLTTPGCSPARLHLVFKKPIQCNSIALNGSDFSITGPQAVSVNSITISCSTQTITTTVIDLHLSLPITTGGNYQLTLTTGSDGNTLLDECGAAVPPGSLSFTAKSSVSALFSYTIHPSCKEDSIYFSHNNTTGVTNWNWSFDNVPGPNTPYPVKIYPATGRHTIQLIVGNGICRDTATQNIVLDNKVAAAFGAPAVICPEDTVHFINKTTGTVDYWKWSFGNGVTSNLRTPPSLHYPFSNREILYTIKLVASNLAMNCSDSSIRQIKVLSGCFIAVPTAFTPNRDGLNDYLHPANALKADNLVFRVYDRFGQLVFETRDWTKKWDGRINGILQLTGVYAWMLSFTHHDTGEKVFMKGTTVLIR